VGSTDLKHYYLAQKLFLNSSSGFKKGVLSELDVFGSGLFNTLRCEAKVIISLTLIKSKFETVEPLIAVVPKSVQNGKSKIIFIRIT